MSTMIVFGFIMLTTVYIGYKAVFKKKNGCSSCSSCQQGDCHENLKRYLKDREKIEEK